jgi:hypothetical protein
MNPSEECTNKNCGDNAKSSPCPCPPQLAGEEELNFE